MTDGLIDGYEAVLCDLDGVIYLGKEPVPGAPAVVRKLRERGIWVGFVTNNASRTPDSVAEQLTNLGIDAAAKDVITSAQAGAKLLATRVEPGARVLVVGTDALKVEVAAVGLIPVERAEDEPQAVIQGYHPEVCWPLFNEAAFAIAAGATWIATNTDSSIPSEHGLKPGAGASVAVLQTALKRGPDAIAGKPYPTLMREAQQRAGTDRVIFVGDRIDTDIAGAASVGIDSLLVFSGAHKKTDLITTGPHPTQIGTDIGALLESRRTCAAEQGGVRCGQALASETEGSVSLVPVPDGEKAQLDALWAVANLVWSRSPMPATEEALAQLNLLA